MPHTHSPKPNHTIYETSSRRTLERMFYSLFQTRSRRSRWRRAAFYIVATETHTFAFSIAAQALLSFFPFVVLLLTLLRNVLHSDRLYRSLLALLTTYLPVADAAHESGRRFIIANLRRIVEHHQGVQFASLIVLVLTSAGIFLPLEVALNRVWGATRNRNYLHNWMIAIGLALACGSLGLLSASLTALSETYSTRLARFLLHYVTLPLGGFPSLVRLVSVVLIHLGAIPVTIAVFFLVYWILPNIRVPVRQVLGAAILAGLLWQLSLYIYILLLPHMNFRGLYGPFAMSVSLVLWGYVSALILLAGIEWIVPFSDEAPEQETMAEKSRPTAST